MLAEKKKVRLRFEENSGGEERRNWHERLPSRASLEQEAHSVEATQINLAEGIRAVANYLERSISRQNFLTFGRFQQRPRFILLAAEDF